MFVGATFDNQTVKAKYDGGLYGGIYEDGRLRGCEIATRPNEVVIAPGLLICGGRVVPNEGSHVVEVLNPADEYMRLVLQIDLNAEASRESFEQVSTLLQYRQTAQFQPLVQEDINGEGRVYQMELGVYRTEDGQIVETVREMAQAQLRTQQVYPPPYEEVMTNDIWDGKPVYLQTFLVEPMPNAAGDIHLGTIIGISAIVDNGGYLKTSPTANALVPIPFASSDGLLAVYLSNQNILVLRSQQARKGATGMVWIKYTKE